MTANKVFPTGPDGLPVYPTRAEAISEIERLTAERDALAEALRALVASREEYIEPDEDDDAPSGSVASLYADARRALAALGEK